MAKSSFLDEKLDGLPTAIERRARELAGGIHARGAIPARFWRQAIAERFAAERQRKRDPEWAEATIKRWDRDA